MEKQNNGKRKLSNFCEKHEIFMFNKFPAIGPISLLSSYDDIMDSVIIHRIGESIKSSFFILEKKIRCTKTTRAL